MLNIPGYEVIRILGQGGMATVYLARHLRLERLVAIKVMSRFFVSDSGFYERFDKEARTVAKLNHSNIVTVYDVGVIDGLPYITMEYLPNGDAKSKIKSGISPSEAVAYLNTIADALRFAHQHQCVHRDIKPENILFRQDGSPAIADFGVVKTLSDDSSMTVVGAVIGTPKYMSPEQAQGLDVSEKSDFYSLGVMFHEMLTGQAPYSGDSSVSVLVNHVNSPIPRLNDELKAFQPLISGMMCKTARNRLSDVVKIRQLSHKCLAEYKKRASRRILKQSTARLQSRKSSPAIQPAQDCTEGKTEIWTTPVHPHLSLQTAKPRTHNLSSRIWPKAAKCAAIGALVLGSAVALPGYTLPLGSSNQDTIFFNQGLNSLIESRLSVINAKFKFDQSGQQSLQGVSPKGDDLPARNLLTPDAQASMPEAKISMPEAQQAALIIKSSLGQRSDLDQSSYQKCTQI